MTDKPIAIINTDGPGGNILAIVGAVRRAMRAEGLDTAEYMDRVFAAQTYEQALEISGEYAELMDFKDIENTDSA